VSVNVPAVNVAGLTLVSVGVGFHRVTALVALALVLSAEVTVTLMVFGFGNVLGAV
jgi:hypothetical protein